MRKRIGDYAIALLIILLLNFLLPRLMPGDPITAMYGDVTPCRVGAIGQQVFAV